MKLEIVKYAAADAARDIKPLGALMHACVLDGASIGYVLPYSLEDGENFWRDKVIPALNGFGRVLLVAAPMVPSPVPCSWTTTHRPTSRTAPKCES